MSLRNQKSIQSSAPDFDRSPKLRLDRFQRLDDIHIKALESVMVMHPFLRNRMEVHLPGHRAKHIFQTETLWVWPKFDRRPAQYLIFIDGFAPCIWDPSKQEGFTLRWILPPSFCSRGSIVCLANLLKAENVLQVEDLLVAGDRDMWSTLRFSERWEELRRIWSQLPSDQPLLGVTPRIVKPIPISDWSEHYDASLSWIIQSDKAAAFSNRGPVAPSRWYWWDSVTPVDHKPYHPPALKRSPAVTVRVCATAKPYLKLGLPDTYTLYSGDYEIGIAGIRSLAVSQLMRKAVTADGIVVEVIWDDDFNKYQIIGTLPVDTPVSAPSFFPHAKIGDGQKTYEKAANETITPS